MDEPDADKDLRAQSKNKTQGVVWRRRRDPRSETAAGTVKRER